MRAEVRSASVSVALSRDPRSLPDPGAQRGPVRGGEKTPQRCCAANGPASCAAMRQSPFCPVKARQVVTWEQKGHDFYLLRFATRRNAAGNDMMTHPVTRSAHFGAKGGAPRSLNILADKRLRHARPFRETGAKGAFATSQVRNSRTGPTGSCCAVPLRIAALRKVAWRADDRLFGLHGTQAKAVSRIKVSVAALDRA